MEFIVPKFPSQSVSKILRSNGFENILESEFQNYYQYKNTDLFLTIFKSGDFRDDSGLYFTYGNFSFLSTVDSNDLNFQKFPKDITLFASAFASGSSGYPLCFDTVTEEEKDRILQRNRNATKAMVRLNLKKCNGKFYLPYAGFFAEKAKRDFAILNRNSKNKITDYQDTQKNFILLNIEDFDSYSFIGSNLQEQQAIRRDEKYQDDPEDTISKVFGQYSFDKIFLKRYFENCNFQKDLVLYLSLTNDDFSERKNSMIVDFRESRTQVKFLKFDWENIKEGMNESTTLPSFNLLHIKVRQDSFLWAINNHMPWEDLSIGFQCRIDRVPDVYNVDFWDHFTNVYL
jgi:CMP-N-acetylneuraminate monooxygenase